MAYFGGGLAGGREYTNRHNLGGLHPWGVRACHELHLCTEGIRFSHSPSPRTKRIIMVGSTTLGRVLLPSKHRVVEFR